MAAGLSQPAQAAESVRITDIRVEGLQHVEPGTVFGNLPVRVGDAFSEADTTDAVKALYATGLFRDIQLRADGGVLVVQVEERAVISQLDFTGIKEFDKDMLRKSLGAVGLAEARTYDKATLHRAEQELRNQYLARGYYAAQVSATVTPLARNRVALVFNVEEGEVAKINQIALIGNRAFPEPALLAEMKLSTPNWLSWYTKNDLYSKPKLTADLEALRSFYLNRGYLDFRIESTQVSLSPDKKEIFLTLNLHEGERYRVNGIRLAGELLDRGAQMEALLALHAGETFSSEKLNASTRAMVDLLGTYGYAFATVNPQPQLDEARHEVSLTLLVDPGRRVYVRRVNIGGNSRTSDAVIRRELRQLESAWFDGETLRLSQQRLNRTGYFTDSDVTTEPVPGTADQVDVNVKITEKQTGAITLGVGSSSSDKISLVAGISQDNAFGSGHSLGLQLNTSHSNRTIVASEADPYFTVDGIRRSTEVFYRTSYPLYSSYGDDEYRVVSAGGTLRFGLPLSELHVLNLGLGFEHTRIDVSSNTPASYQAYVAKYGNIFNAVPVSMGLTVDRRDSALVPSKGHYDQFYLEGTLPGMGLEYYRASYQHQSFYPLSKGLTLAFNGEAAFGHGYGGNDYPVFKNYYAGGIGSVRGYATGTLGPKDTNGNAVGGTTRLVGSIELGFPVPGTGADRTLRLFTFLDAGNVYAEGVAPSLGELRYSSGLGLSWISPIGPLKVSLGFPLRKKEGDETQRFQFQIGTAF